MFERGYVINRGLTVDRRSDRPRYRATMAGFWPHSGAQRYRLLRIAEQHFSRSTDCIAWLADAPATLRRSEGRGRVGLTAAWLGGTMRAYGHGLDRDRCGFRHDGHWPVRADRRLCLGQEAARGTTRAAYCREGPQLARLRNARRH